MNIKISIKDCDCLPSMINNKQLTETQLKKKAMLYAPPEHDTNIIKGPTKQKNKNKKKSNINYNSNQYKQSQKLILDELNKHNQNQATLDIVNNNNNILQKQNQILSNNQKTLQEIVKNQNKYQQQIKNKQVSNLINQKLNEIKKQIQQLKKMKTQFLKQKQLFDKYHQKSKPSQIPPHLNQMHSNLKNQIKTSQNNLEFMNNIEVVKGLQNFNIEAYTQALNSLKKQIIQYQKQSDNIEKQLKIRTSKLQKLNISPQFQQQLYKPYQQHLNNCVKNIDLYSIKQKIYDKIGTFDYAKFQYDIGITFSQIKNQLGNFPLICKQHQIIVPDIKIDQKQLKNLDIKVPSVLQQYKLRKGIKFDDQIKQLQKTQKQLPKSTKTSQIQHRLKYPAQSKKPQNLQKIITKPQDQSNPIKLIKNYNKKQTILFNQNKLQKQQLQSRINNNNNNNNNKKYNKQIKQNQQFNKYLQNRARQQLQILYRQKKQHLLKIQNQLYQSINNPIFIDLNLDQQQLKNKKYSTTKQPNNQTPSKQQQHNQNPYIQQQFQQNTDDNQKNKPISQQNPNYNKNINIKQLGRQILKSKLKNIMEQKNKYLRSSSQPQNFPSQPLINNQRHIQNMAEGFINMINNTLTQVNNNLSKTIQSKIQHNSDRRPTSLQQRSPKKISIPQLQAFRPPPVFNVNLVKQPRGIPYIPQQPIYHQQQQQKKIIVEDYDQYKIKESSDYNDLIVSSQDDEDDSNI